jgi:kynureninase
VSSSRERLLDEARALDAQDPLRAFRHEFYLPRTGVYFDGNSLGLLSRPAEARLMQAIEDWKQLAIDGFTQARSPWFHLAEALAQELAPLIGAHADEVIIANSTSVNLHQILATFYRPRQRRTRIVTDEYAFPTDVYVIQSQMRLHGLDWRAHLLTVKNRRRLIEEDEIVRTMDEHRDEIAMLVLPGVVYTTGQLLDIARLSQEAHRRGILLCVDACHSIGSVPQRFGDWDVDFAVWCNYKYLNGGPGAVAGLYVNRRHFGAAPGLAGWFSSEKAKQFDMAHEPRFAQTAGAYQIGTPPVLSLCALSGSLELIHRAGIDAIREKSVAQTRFLIGLVRRRLAKFGFELATPETDARRGGHVAIAHVEAARIAKALKQQRVVPDFRPPDLIRLAPIALYTRYEDLAEVVFLLERIMERKAYLEFPNVRGEVA